MLLDGGLFVATLLMLKCYGGATACHTIAALRNVTELEPGQGGHYVALTVRRKFRPYRYTSLPFGDSMDPCRMLWAASGGPRRWPRCSPTALTVLELVVYISSEV